PGWIRTVLIGTCGGVSFAHGSNDGQKGMGLLVLVLIGFLPIHYALTVNDPSRAPTVLATALEIREDYKKAGIEMPQKLAENLAVIEKELQGKESFEDLPRDRDIRWEVRQAIMNVTRELKAAEGDAKLPKEFRDTLAERRKKGLLPAVEYIPLWVVIGTA